MYKFDALAAKNSIVKYIREWMDNVDPTQSAKIVIGISGGKDSTIVAKLCCEAIGVSRVLGVMIPNGYQSDLDVSKSVCDFLGIKNITVNIGSSHDFLLNSIESALKQEVTVQTKNNLPPRLRMATLYAVAQTVGGFVVNTSNLSEDWIGWATYGGDTLGAFGPISLFTCSEVVAIGDCLGLPHNLVHKDPSDGLTNRTDEDNFGFTYEVLDKYIRTGECDDKKVKESIDLKHTRNLFKISPMDVFSPEHDILYDTDSVDVNNISPSELDRRYGWIAKL